MGHVYKAWDGRLHREVAIKLLHNEFSMSGMRERFLREARAASALNHPNICTIFDIGEQDGDPYLVMELLEGETLRDRILNRTLQTDEIVCVAKEVGEALGAAHAKGIIHRDIKPANIFLVDRPNGTTQSKVLDFGLAKIEGGVLGARGSRSMDITTAGSTVGTLAYMSPEQARGETLDSRSDLFSLGVVLYEMATRHVPFQGATSALVFVKLLNHPPEPVRDWNEAIPKDLERIIFKLMAKERTLRFQTAQELVEAVSHVGEKGDRGNWLRKAVSTVPLVRAPDPVARERRVPSNRKASDAFAVSPREVIPAAPAEVTPRPSNDGAQFLRPVARVPRGDTSPRPSSVPTVSPEAAVESIESISQGSPELSAASKPDSADRLKAQAAANQAVLTQTVASQTVASQTVASQTVASQAAGSRTDSLPAENARDEFHTAFLEEEETEKPPKPGLVSPRNLVIAIVVLVLLAAAAIYLLDRGRFGSALLSENDTLVVTEIENRTGDKLLDGSIAEGLQIALAQSPYLRLAGDDSYGVVLHRVRQPGGDAGGPAAVHEAAKVMKATAYLLGTVTGSTAPYLIHVELRNTGTNEVISTAEERVSSLQEFPAAVDRLAVEIRSAAGEDGDSIAHSSNPLSREGTGNLEALHDYALADAARYGGKPIDALHLYEQANTLEPKFVQAHLREVTIYRKLRAEVAAAEAAKLALAAADNTGERTRAMAQYEYEMNTSGDFVRAAAIIRRLLQTAPHDSAALEALARALRLQGHMAEALQTAQQAYEEDPYNAEAYGQAESSLIGLDRYDASYQLEEQVIKLGLARPGTELTSSYLEGRQGALDEAIAKFEAPNQGYRPDWVYGVYLDNGGRMTSGAAVWRNRAEAAGKVEALKSASAFLLSQGALDRALVGNCADGEAMAHDSDELQQGLTALFNTGMTHALCGNAARARQILGKLQSGFPQSFAVTGYYLADIQAALALHDGDPAAALDALRSARQFDLISLTPYLRGKAHVALRQLQIGIVDFQTVLAHRGVTFLVGSNVYPVAEIGVARAFADTGDLGNSAQAYRHFLDLWKEADPGQPLVAEARARIN